MRKFGLIGKKLGHSFSKKYFSEKFENENIHGCAYELYELPDIKRLKKLLLDHPALEGLNVTIPYKEEVLPFLDEIDEKARRIGAVNVVRKLANGTLKGYNSDYYGFRRSLENWLGERRPGKALILGTGGASKAVCVALEDMDIAVQFVSRKASETCLTYEQLKESEDIFKQHRLIVNTTPLGMHPHLDSFPDLPYEWINEHFFMYDLVYNPETTAFMKKGAKQGACAKNGLEMLVLQAEKSWEIWNDASGFLSKPE
ncbi:MAG: shikimate dehydrogenase [Cytophagales bacterium]|nr:shikimate dehydrogenase [Cytophagales bacterium]